jgi:D-alanyl-D-alanine-carboxypeptidase/D-alanyl-D-alanine-endopeptidase
VNFERLNIIDMWLFRILVRLALTGTPRTSWYITCYAAVALSKAGFRKDRPAPVGEELGSAYRAVGAIYRQGDVEAAADQLAMNFLMDRDAAGWGRDLASLRKQVGDCDTAAAMTAASALSGEFTWRCTHGRVTGTLLLAPTHPPRIQSIKLERKTP